MMNRKNNIHSDLRRYENLKRGWRFTAQPQKVREADAYQLTKSGAGVSPAAMSYDDHAWDVVELPHDYSVLQDLDAEADNYNGYLERKNCWYRRFFQLEETDTYKRIMLHFDGVSGAGKIWINGCLMKEYHSSFCDIVLDISDVVRYGKEVNLIAVQMYHETAQGWWYQGEGLYREVWLEITGRYFIDEQELRICTKHEEEETWEVTVFADVAARYGAGETIQTLARISDSENREIAFAEQTVKLDTVLERQQISLAFHITSPKLWQVYEGNCYTLQLEVEKDGIKLDSYSEYFGFREFYFDPERGFFLNGKHTEIKGLCFHEDEGNLGWAIDASVYERRILNLIAMGANAYRCSHNAPARELLDLCDKYGILVMDETRRFDSGEIGLSEFAHLIRRDRNHPCIILWSLGNEEPWQEENRGKRVAETMRRVAYKLDGTRPVTLAMHTGLLADGAAEALDVIGVNYNHEQLEQIHDKYPDKPMIGSEILCLADEIIESENSYPGSQGALETLKFAEENFYYSGTFGWAGADYRGEHRNLAFFTDACPLNCNGNRKDGFYRYAARWKTEPLVHICGHWNADSYLQKHLWQGGPKEPEHRKVRVISNQPNIQLFLNGELVGEAQNNDTQVVEFDMIYIPGELKAVGFRDGEAAVVDTLKTTGRAQRFTVQTEAAEYPADGRSRITAWIEAVDEDGNVVPMSAYVFRVACDGPGSVICTDNADPYCSCFPEKEEMCLYQGRGKCVLQAGTEEGSLRITVSGSGLKAAECTVKLISPAEPRMKCAKVVESPYINDWFVSHIYEKEPDIYEYTTDENYIYWRKSLERASMVERQLPFFYTRGKGDYVIYCMEPDMPQLENGDTGAVVFEEITGTCKILVSMRDYENRLIKRIYCEKTQERSGSVRVELPGICSGDRLIIKAIVKGIHSKCGITGPVRFEV